VTAIRVTELEGDGIGPELQQSVAAVAEALPIDMVFDRIDWSLDTRERDVDKAIDAAAASMQKNKLALKYPTVTKTRSPNALIRRRLDFSVIYRPCISIAGIESHFKQAVNLHIVRIATGGTYEDPGQYVGRDAAVSVRIVEREPCAQAAHFAFELARKKGLKMTSSSKHTVQKVTDGLFEAVVREIAADYSDVAFGNELFDALLAKIILRPQD
jgi:isocitrate dehydrogenase (NAD+)